MVKLRDPALNKMPTPTYDPNKQFVTLVLHYGGLLFEYDNNELQANYEAGSVYKLDHYDIARICLDGINIFCEKMDLPAVLGCYVKVGNKFKKLKDDDHLHQFCLDKLHETREIDVYLNHEDGFMSHFDNVEAGKEINDEGEEGDEEDDEEDHDYRLLDDFHDSDYDNMKTTDSEDTSDAELEDEADEATQTTADLQNESTNTNADCLNYFGDEDINPSADELDSQKGSDSENETPKFPVFNPSLVYDPPLSLGLLFKCKADFRKAIQSHAIVTKRSINITTNDKRRIYAKCADKKCKWKIHANKVVDAATFQIRAYIPDHTCALSFNVKNMKSTWIAQKYLKKFKHDPKRSVKGFRDETIEEVQCHISEEQAYRAKRKALKLLEGNPDEQFGWLWDYAHEIRRTNPGSTVIVGTEQSKGKNLFDRIYVGLHALKVGFSRGCRPLIGVDGCHLKGPHLGILLTAVSLDPNNNIYPISYAVVQKESGDTWDWFLTILKCDLNLEDGITFMSDKQKGLVKAFSEVFPNCPHRFCVRHLYANFVNAGFRGEAFKNVLWKAANATTENGFMHWMEKMKDLSNEAFEWFSDKPPEQWCRAYFSTTLKCDMLLNNICEAFNSSILHARELPIFSMLNWIMEHLMQKLQENRDRSRHKWIGERGDICPRIKNIINKRVARMGSCIPIKSDDMHYLVRCLDDEADQYSVDLEQRTCGCRKWDLTGIPCKHACRAIHCQGLQVEHFVDKCYSVDTYNAIYETAIMPINGKAEWKKTDFAPPLPPNEGRSVGRPSVTRRSGPDEVQKKIKKRSRGKPKKGANPNQLKRQQITLKCKKCGGEGHNKRNSLCPLFNIPDTNTQAVPMEEGTSSGAKSSTTDAAVKVRKRKVTSLKPQVATDEQKRRVPKFEVSKPIWKPTGNPTSAAAPSVAAPRAGVAAPRMFVAPSAAAPSVAAPRAGVAAPRADADAFAASPSMFDQLQQGKFGAKTGVSTGVKTRARAAEIQKRKVPKFEAAKPIWKPTGSRMFVAPRDAAPSDAAPSDAAPRVDAPRADVSSVAASPSIGAKTGVNTRSRAAEMAKNKGKKKK